MGWARIEQTGKANRALVRRRGWPACRPRASWRGRRRLNKRTDRVHGRGDCPEAAAAMLEKNVVGDEMMDPEGDESGFAGRAMG